MCAYMINIDVWSTWMNVHYLSFLLGCMRQTSTTPNSRSERLVKTVQGGRIEPRRRKHSQSSQTEPGPGKPSAGEQLLPLFSLWGHVIGHLLHSLAFLSRRPLSAPSFHGPGSTMTSGLLSLSLNSEESGSEWPQSWVRWPALVHPLWPERNKISQQNKAGGAQVCSRAGVGRGAVLKKGMYVYSLLSFKSILIIYSACVYLMSKLIL